MTKEINIHMFITKNFNVQFNKFIADNLPKKVIKDVYPKYEKTTRYELWKKWESKIEPTKYTRYAFELLFFRNKLFLDCGYNEVEESKFGPHFLNLLMIYVEVHTQFKRDVELKKLLQSKFINLAKELDNQLNTHKYLPKLKRFPNELPTITFKIKNIRGMPVINQEIKIFQPINQEHYKHSREELIHCITTDKNGEVRIRLPWAIYRYELAGRNISEYIDLKENINVELNIKSIKEYLVYTFKRFIKLILIKIKKT